MKREIKAILCTFLTAALLSGCGSETAVLSEMKTQKYVTLGEYKGLEVSIKKMEVTEELKKNYIDYILSRYPQWIQVTDDSKAEEGDIVDINFEGKLDGVAFEGGTGRKEDLQLGSGAFIEGFEDSVIGHNIGDAYDWQGKFPDNYQNAEYAGKDVVFTITVKGIAEESVPELNDNFVKSVSEKSKSVKEYKEEVRKQLTDDNETSYENQVGQAVWQKVLENTEIKKYPEDEMKELSKTLIDQYKSMAEYAEQDYETYIQEQMGYSVEEFEKQVEEAAKASLKQSMVTEAIADKEKIKLSNKEYKEQLKKIADSYMYEDVDALKEAAEEEDLKDIALNNMVREWLKEHSVQVAKK